MGFEKIQKLFEEISAGCKHEEIVEYMRFACGCAYGRCTSCGETSFQIRDVGYEKFLEVKNAGGDIDEAMAEWRIHSIGHEKALEPAEA